MELSYVFPEKKSPENEAPGEFMLFIEFWSMSCFKIIRIVNIKTGFGLGFNFCHGGHGGVVMYVTKFEGWFHRDHYQMNFGIRSTFRLVNLTNIDLID